MYNASEIRINSLVISLLAHIDEKQGFSLPEELFSALTRVRSIVTFMTTPLEQCEKATPTTLPDPATTPPEAPVEETVPAAPQSTQESEKERDEGNTPVTEKPTLPEKEKKGRKKKDEDNGTTCTPYDGKNREHKKILTGILKGEFDFDFDVPKFQQFAGEINSELTERMLDVSDISVLTANVSLIIDSLKEKFEGAPF